MPPTTTATTNHRRYPTRGVVADGACRGVGLGVGVGVVQKEEEEEETV